MMFQRHFPFDPALIQEKKTIIPTRHTVPAAKPCFTLNMALLYHQPLALNLENAAQVHQ